MFGDFFKNFLQNEREEIEKHKTRIILLIFLAVATIIFSFSDFGDNAENISVETSQVEVESDSEKKLQTLKRLTIKKFPQFKKLLMKMLFL